LPIQRYNLQFPASHFQEVFVVFKNAIKLFIALFVLVAPVARAGLGPQNIFLIVNSASLNSLAVANEYIDARHIPATNVVYLDLPKQFIESIDVDNFRKLILQPVLDQIKQRKLAGQIDCIAYSADFPHAVQLKTDIGDEKLGKVMTPVGSINGLTYLYSSVMKKDLAYLMLGANRYAPAVHRMAATRRTAAIAMVPARGFRRLTGWTADGSAMPNRPDQGYLLSTVIGITAGRGNTVDEIRQMIRRSVAADGTAPNGTIYYLVNGDVRSKARQWGFRPAVEQLNRLGVNGEIIEGTLPMNRKDVAGTMVGIADFDWGKSGSTILPGAICEHLTSYGGIMFGGGGQTPLSAFIRAGASGASGTVTEPFAIQEKFPSPFIHVYYAAGCTLAEAFYQSVSGPYQLLIVGDPLCKPWGKLAELGLGIEAGTLKGTVTLNPVSKSAQFVVGKFDLYIDGVWNSTVASGAAITLDTTTFQDGYHELRLIAIASDAIESQVQLILPIHFNNRNQHVSLKPPIVQPGKPTFLAASLAGAKRLVLECNGHQLASADGDVKAFPLDAAQMGAGPVMLQVIGIVDVGGHEERIASDPVRILN
jgi:uncharacterized protein (TIGR03790 family)